MNYDDELDRMRAQKRRGSGAKRSVDNRSGRASYEAEDGRRMRVEYAERPDVSQKLRTDRMRKKRRKKRLLLIELAVLAILAAGTFFVLKGRTHQKGYWTIAVFGVDSRDGKLEKGALSDVEMICNIDKATGEIRLVSIYRDTYLKINSEGTYHKINEAYFKGGHKQAVEALNENLDLKIDDYATFNWKSVAEAINILGGVDIEITDAEFSYINGFITETVNSTGIGSYQLKKAGMNHLDGVQAVAYSRLRLMDTDFNRTERQRKVVMLALEKAKQANFGTLKTLVSTVFPQISTSIGIDDLFTIARGITRYHIGETEGFPFSRTTMRLGKMDCVIATTLESNVVQLHRFLYHVENYSPSSTVKSISARIAKETGITEPGESAPTGGGSTKKNPAGTPPAPKETASPEPAGASEESTEAAVESAEETETGAETEDETTAETKTETKTAAETAAEDTGKTEAGGDGSLIGPGVGLNGSSGAGKETKKTEEETSASKQAATETAKAPEAAAPSASEEVGPGI